MIASCLTAAGYRTGLYTSPHLVDFRERIRIDGRKIPASRLAAYTALLRPGILRTGSTFFEATTAIAFQYFADEEVDVAVIETGLGGRWDSTNVVTPMVSVITSIGLDHRELLGDTVREIASEKAGIVKPGVPCVVGGIGGAALDVIRRRARRTGSKLVRALEAVSAARVRYDVEGLTGDFRTGGNSYRGLRVDARGPYQEGNARIALSALATLGAARPEFRVGSAAVRRGLGSLRRSAGFAGRFHLVSRDPPILVDVAHNPDGVAALVGALRAVSPGKHPVVIGVVREKDFRPMIDLLRPVARMFYVVRAGTPRSRDPRDLVDYAHSTRTPARLGGAVAAGLRRAISENQAGETVLVTGSHYVAGEALTALGIRV